VAERLLNGVSQRIVRWFVPLVLSVCAWVAFARAGGLDAGVTVGAMAGPGWAADGVVVKARVGPDGGLGWSLGVDTVHIEGFTEPLRGVWIDCERASLGRDVATCGRLRFELQAAGLGTVRGEGGLAWRRRGESHLAVEQGHLAGGTFGLELRWGETGSWRLALHGRGLELARLAASIPGLAGEAGGRLSLDGRMAAEADTLQASLTLDGVDLSYSEPTGTREAQGVGLHAQLEARRSAGRWRGGIGVRVHAGQLYWDPWYLEPARGAIQADLEGRLDPEAGTLELTRFRYHDPGSARIEGALALRTHPRMELSRLNVRRMDLVLPAAYETYLRPALIGTVLDDLETAGRIGGELELSGQTVTAVEVSANDVLAADRRGRFALRGLEGVLRWGAGRDAGESRVHLDALSFYRLVSGAFDVRLRPRGRGLELASPVRVPVFDGRLEIDRFELRDLADPRAGWSFDAVLTPVSMPALTHALQWPEMEGTLSGVIPDVVYDGGVLRVGGALLVRVFDGAVVVDDLTLEDPFGVVPVLRADARLRNLDLDLLTRRFRFGRITGRLGGYVRDLVLEDWAPVRFDAWLGTPAGDRSRHRISQRAVENLSSLGGGPTAVLSSGFLRMFESFSYDRLGLGCRLERGVCTMRGVEPAKGGGYYIVKGAGLPRIDVIGYRERVDWERLVERLADLSLEGGPVVE